MFTQTVAQTVPNRNQSSITQLEAEMQRRWHDLAMAEDRGLSSHVLERMFAKYMVALETFIATQQVTQRQQANVA